MIFIAQIGIALFAQGQVRLRISQTDMGLVNLFFGLLDDGLHGCLILDQRWLRRVLNGRGLVILWGAGG